MIQTPANPRFFYEFTESFEMATFLKIKKHHPEENGNTFLLFTSYFCLALTPPALDIFR
jgi:hypothetical protein